jgi:hypothetical protein
MSHLTPDQVLATPAGELAERSSDSLFQLKNDAADLLAAAKAIVEHVDRALDLRYAQRAHQPRRRPQESSMRSRDSSAIWRWPLSHWLTWAADRPILSARAFLFPSKRGPSTNSRSRARRVA